MKNEIKKSLKIFLIFALVILPISTYITYLVTGSASSIDTLLFSSSDQYRQIWEISQGNGVFLYIVFKFTVDLIWPLVYYNLFRKCNHFFVQNNKLHHLVEMLLLMILFSDYLENLIGIVFLLINQVQMTFVILLMILTNLKWVGVLIVIIMLLISYWKGMKTNGSHLRK